MLGRQVDIKRKDTGSAEPDEMEVMGGVFELGGIEFSADSFESTLYGSASPDWRTFEQGLKDGGEIPITIEYDPTNAQAVAMQDAFHNGTLEIVQLVFPAPINIKFDIPVIVTKLGIPTPKGEKVRLNLSLKVSGEPTEAAVA
jgi:hypothetical protein